MIGRSLCLAVASLSLMIQAALAEGPVPAGEATARFKLPEGFQATLFAGEPDVVQPIAFTFDDRGRLWVVENYSYPGWSEKSRDRVLILEDRDGDGRFDERKVFWDQGSNLSGIEWGFGGIWLCSTPNLVFVPDADGDDVPDGPAVIKLDGFDPQARHNVSSSLAWGPDGWLWGCNGILSNSKLGKPGTPDAERTAMNCGVWRYHPTRETFEVVAHGTTNPWGLDFDQYGQAFITNCVIEHLWHVVPGARFQRMFGQDFHPHAYELMSTCADHIHWAGGHWTDARGGEAHDSHGGGHAHVGAMIYLGDNWPDAYRQHIYMCNVHGNRINSDRLERQGSGYVARHARDFLLAGDSWFRGIALKYGPDGGAYVSDWTDTGECHNYEVVDQSNGRIYKITYGRPKAWTADLARMSDRELIALQRHKNEWQVRHARRILQERHARGTLAGDTRDVLLAMLDVETDPVLQLRKAWCLHAIGAIDDALIQRLLASEHNVVRGWGVQLEFEDRQLSPAMASKIVQLAGDESSPWVRLALASALQRADEPLRRAIAERLVAHADDAADRNLSLLLWYGVSPSVAADRSWAIGLSEKARIPRIRRYIARCLALPGEPAGIESLLKLMAAGDDTLREPVLAGLHEALQGRRRMAMPEGWSALYQSLSASKVEAIRQRALLLALIFGDARAFAQLRVTAADAGAETPAREQAIAALTQAKADDLPSLLFGLLSDEKVRVAALRGLAAYDDRATPEKVLASYGTFDLSARQEAISTLSARAGFALALLDAVEQGKIPRGDLTAFHVQQLQSLNDSAVRKRVAQVWGTARATSAERAQLIAQYKVRLTSDVLAKADPSRGRAVFAKNCAACHTLFDAGGKIGPELTGSQRTNLDYVLSNVLDPSAVVAREYQMQLVQTTDGRVLSGIIKHEDDNGIQVQTATELVVVPKDEIEARQATSTSMMPDGLLLSLSEAEVRDLVRYLASPGQQPLPEDAPRAQASE